MAVEVQIGTVSDFFARPVVAGIVLEDELKVGDRIRIEGHTSHMEFVIESMQIDGKNVQEAKPGDNVGIKVPDRVRRGDRVVKVSE